MKTKAIDKKNRFYKMNKALQLVEGTIVAAFWAHLMDAYSFFEVNGMLEKENTLYQSSKVIQAFTGIGTKAQNSAKKRLTELDFLKYRVASKPGEATKTTIFVLYPDVFEKWMDDHDYDKLRNEKYLELQPEWDKDRLDQWFLVNTSLPSIQVDTDLGQMQIAEGTFANHTHGHLQIAEGTFAKRPKDICKVPKEHVIETIEVETLKVENTQKSDQGCVYSKGEYELLHGKSKREILELIIDTYSREVKASVSEAGVYDMNRFIGSIERIEVEFNKLDIAVGVNFYIGLLGYLKSLQEKLPSNPKAFDAAHKLENLLKFKSDIVFSVANKKAGKPIYERAHSPNPMLSKFVPTSEQYL